MSEQKAEFGEALADYIVRVDSGEDIDRDEFLRANAPYQDDLRAFFSESDALLEILSGSDVGTSRPTRPLIDVPDRIGEYQLLECLGVGGMGDVYRAQHTVSEAIVAVKVMHDSVHCSSARFRRELQLLAKLGLDHQNIARALGGDQSDSLSYLVTEYVDGVDLHRLVMSWQPVSVSNACEITRQVANGLQHANDNGIVHRDVKPSNVMVDRSGIVKLLDFGLALTLEPGSDERISVDGQIPGTADYIASERWKGVEADVRSDIYGLGCMFYFLVCGKPPFADWENKVRAHTEQAPPQLTERCPGVPDDVVAIIGRMLEKDPARRFQQPSEVAAAVEPFVQDSDLIGLVDSYHVANLTPPTPLLEVERNDGTTDAMELNTELNDSVELSPPRDLQSTRTSIKPRSKRRHRIGLGIHVSWILALIVIMTAAGAIVLRLPDKDTLGELVIESNDVRTMIVVSSGGETVMKVQLVVGPNRIRLNSGEYQIEIIGINDGVVVKDGTVRVTRDGKVIAKIYRVKSPAGIAQSQTEPGVFPWVPGTGDATLAGLASKPMHVPGLGRWQVETVAPREPIHRIAWSPNGRWLACGSHNSQVRIYEVDGNELRLFRMLPAIAGLVEWSPDSQKIAASYLLDGKQWHMVEIYDVQNARLIMQLKGEGRVGCIGWSPDGETIASGSAGRQTVILWDPKSGNRKKRLATTAHTLAWNPDHQAQLLAADDGEKIQIWHLADQSVVAEFEGHAEMSWSPCGNKLAYRGPQNRFQVWDQASQTSTLVSETYDASQVRWSPNGKYVVTAANYSAMIWAVDDDKFSSEPAVVRDATARTNFSWHPDGTRLAFTDHGSIHLWDAENGSTVHHFARNHLTFARWSPDGSKLATGWSDNSVRIWNADGKPIQRFVMQDDRVNCLNWSQDGSSVVAGGDNSIQSWNLSSNASKHLAAPRHVIRDIEWLEDGSIMSCGNTYGVGLFRWTEGTRDPKQISATANSFAASHDGHNIAWTENGQGVHIWNLRTDQRNVLLDESNRKFSDVRWSPKGQQIACFTQTTADWQVFLIDVTTEAIVWTNEGGHWSKYPDYISWSPDGEWIQVGDRMIAAQDGKLQPKLTAGQFLPWAWNPQRGLVALPYETTIQVANMSDRRAIWKGVPLTAELSASFNPAGQLLNPDPEVEKHLVWIVEDKNRNADDLNDYPSIDLLSRDEFLQRIQPRLRTLEGSKAATEDGVGSRRLSDAGGE